MRMHGKAKLEKISGTYFRISLEFNQHSFLKLDSITYGLTTATDTSYGQQYLEKENTNAAHN
jgi:hypothetical protein